MVGLDQFGAIDSDYIQVFLTPYLGPTKFNFQYIFRAIYFRLKYIHNVGYQNHYITNEFLEIDEQRKHLQMETVLPLTFMESLKYPGVFFKLFSLIYLLLKVLLDYRLSPYSPGVVGYSSFQYVFNYIQYSTILYLFCGLLSVLDFSYDSNLWS